MNPSFRKGAGPLGGSTGRGDDGLRPKHYARKEALVMRRRTALAIALAGTALLGGSGSALAAGPFITTINDLLGLTIYFFTIHLLLQ